MGGLGPRGARLAAVVAAALAGCGPAAAASWTGTYRLPASAEPVAISIGADGTVALGPGHLGPTPVAVTVRGGRLRVALPGRPAPVAFVGRVRGRSAAGTVTQGTVRGAFRLTRRAASLEPKLGLYGSVAVVKAEGFAPWLVDLRSGDIHGLGARTVGTLLGTTSGSGTYTAGSRTFAWSGGTFTRTRVRQFEVRIGALAGTLTLPPGPGPFPAAVGIHGSGPLDRAHFQVFEALLVSHGIAFLAYDKRGIGQSGGVYPGERATDSTIDALARDVQAAVKFMAAQPEIDRARLGVMGDSQAGWIAALAASREPAIRWALLLAGPTTTVGETDLWGSLAGQGATPPSAPFAALEAKVRANGLGGLDPVPYLRKLAIPVDWIFGADDRNVPTALCVDVLERIHAGHAFAWTVIPGMNHSLLELQDGLSANLLRSHGFQPGLFQAIAARLGARGLGQ